MESTDSSEKPHLPPGFRFHPTDEELVVHYLKKKAASAPLPVAIIAEVDLYKFDPWELPAKAIFGEQEWYFFSPRDRKYPNGARPNRAATSGYWKATGTDKPVLTAGGTHKVGVKKALVFYGGKPPKGIKTNWIMHEYRLSDNNNNNNNNNKPPGYDHASKKGSLRLDDWVLCRIYKKHVAQRPLDHDTNEVIINNNNNNKPSPPCSYGSSFEEHGFYDQPMMSTMMMSSSKPPHQQFPFVDPNDDLHLSAGKRALPNLFWNEDDDANANATNSPTTKRFLADHHHQAPGMVNIFGQQAAGAGEMLDINSNLGGGDNGVFRYNQVSGMNWYT